MHTRPLLAFAALLSASTAPFASSALAKEGDPAPLARIDGESVGTEDLEAYRLGLPESRKPIEGAGRPLLEELINRRLLLRKARQRGLPQEKAVRMAMERARQDVLIDALLNRVIAERMAPQRVRSFYQRHFSSHDRVERLEVTLAAAPSRESAASLKERLAAAEPGENGPEAPPEARTKRVFPPLLAPKAREALTGGDPGKVVGPVALDGQWRVYRIDRRSAVEPPELSEVRSAIAGVLRDRTVRLFLRELRESADIDYPQDTPGKP